jgi:hypothetical protein
MVPHPVGRPWRLEWSYRIAKTNFVHGLLSQKPSARETADMGIGRDRAWA